jgi:hypothetical protein
LVRLITLSLTTGVELGCGNFYFIILFCTLGLEIIDLALVSLICLLVGNSWFCTGLLSLFYGWRDYLSPILVYAMTGLSFLFV